MSRYVYHRVVVTASTAKSLRAPNGKRWIFQYALVKIVADANVANRYVRLQILSEDGSMLEDIYNAVVTASQTKNRGFGQGYRGTEANQWTGTPNYVIQHGVKIQFNVNSGQAGDVTTIDVCFKEEDLDEASN